jgi:hypothetical protein
MRDPRNADLAATSLHYCNSDRALAIVSICCDAIARCTEALYRLAPCKIEPHYLIIAIDVMSRLQEAADKKIAEIAKSNLLITMRILKSVMNAIGEKGAQVLGPFDNTDNCDMSAESATGGLAQFLGRLASLNENSAPCT